ncbi:MAG: InlB B-repeat-containing protein, partial [Christensenellaceae bacterium]|nr:InlB B-repeat-containing protein [Christensenellaceae bacterium]
TAGEEIGILYVANGGSGAVQKTIAASGASVTLLNNTFARIGYTFSGWLDAPNGDTVYEVGSSYKLSSSLVTMYAKWTPKQATLTIDLDYGAVAGDNITTLTYDTQYTLLQPSKQGYVFTGYFDSSNNNPFSISGIYLNAETTSIELTAKYSPILYTVVFNLNGGTGSIAPHSYEYDKESALPNIESISRTGYKFDKWQLGDTEYIEESQPIKNLSNTDHAIITLVAQWTPVTYYARYYASADSVDYQEQTLTYDTEGYIPDLSLTKTGYSFDRWSRSPDGTGNHFEVSAPLLNLANTDQAAVNFYAVWSPITYFVDFYSNGGSGTMPRQTFTYDIGSSLISNTEIKYAGFAFVGWSTSSDGEIVYANSGSILNACTTQDAILNLYAVWKAGAYAVTYLNNAVGASGTMENSVHVYGANTPLSTPGFIRPGYSIVGWSLIPGDSNPVDFVPNYSKSQITTGNSVSLYAVWQINSYTISFNTNGGTFVPSIFATFGSTFVIPSGEQLPLKPGAQFTGWYIDEALTEPFTSNVMPSSNLIVYAAWKDTGIYYTMSFNSAGGTHVDSKIGVYGSLIGDVSDPEKTGYLFLGWFVNQGDITPYTLDTMPAQDLALTARWVPHVYEIIFKTDGAGNLPKVVEHYGSPLELPTVSKTGHSFDGWFTDESRTQLFEDTTMPAGNTTLWAKWTRSAIDIGYVTNDGSAIQSESVMVGEQLPAHTPTREGFVFTGWYLNKELTIPSTYEVAPDVDLILYAGWAKDTAHSYSLPGWAIALIIIIILLIIAAIIFIVLSLKKREQLWKK